jgi:DNA polymerase I-like protein with 3'-5' exonuclease and polymerase domains
MINNYVVMDVETTTSNKGNPFDVSNKLCYVGLKTNPTYDRNLYDIEYSDHPYRDNLREIQSVINSSTLLIGFNIKFDLHWVRNYGITFTNCRVWDCQLVHFILSGQSESYPSLNDVALHYNLGTKLDVVSEQYWKLGIDTPDIPRELLEGYLQMDLDLTEQVYLKQVEELERRPELKRLVSLHNQDLLVLEEMEYNGLLYDAVKSEELACELEERIVNLDDTLFQYHNCTSFNPNSNDHLSNFLYGGALNLRRKEAIGYFKTGVRAGEVKEKWVDYQIELPRLVKPLKGSELLKENCWSTDEQTLRNLKGSKKAQEVIELLLLRAELEKRVSTYYRGLLKLSTTMKWEDNHIHGQLNQCVARTGRLSSSRPNLQNFDGDIKGLFYSRYD